MKDAWLISLCGEVQAIYISSVPQWNIRSQFMQAFNELKITVVSGEMHCGELLIILSQFFAALGWLTVGATILLLLIVRSAG